MSIGEVCKDWAARMRNNDRGFPLPLPADIFDGMGSSNMFFMRSYSQALKDEPHHRNPPGVDGAHEYPPWTVQLFGKEMPHCCKDVCNICSHGISCVECPSCCLGRSVMDVFLSVSVVLSCSRIRKEQPFFVTQCTAFAVDKASIFIYSGRDMITGVWAPKQAKDWVAVTWVARR